MSKLLSKRVYDYNDWRRAQKGDRVQRIFIHMMDEEGRFPLSDKDHRVYEAIKKCFSIMSEHTSMAKVHALTKTASGLKSDAAVYRIINETKQIFGNIIESNKKFERFAMTERLYEIARRAKESGAIKEEIEALKQIRLLNALHVEDDKGADMPTEIPKAIFTDDPAFITAPDAEEIEIDES